ncbi:hypothetical protein MTO96_049196 [Rhipicephalus appendiculatus]
MPLGSPWSIAFRDKHRCSKVKTNKKKESSRPADRVPIFFEPNSQRGYVSGAWNPSSEAGPKLTATGQRVEPGVTVCHHHACFGCAPSLYFIIGGNESIKTGRLVCG